MQGETMINSAIVSNRAEKYISYHAQQRLIRKRRSMNINADVFNYSDYRAFLKEFYSDKKAQSKKFTFSLFAALTGFSSPSFLKLVMEGKKNLTKPSVLKIVRGLRLRKKPAQYFEDLVFFNQAGSLEDKSYFLDRINKYRKKNKPEKLLSAEYDYLREWYHCVIREMIDLKGFKEDPRWIAKKLLYTVKADDIAGSLKFLEDKGFIGRDGSGTVFKKDKTIATGPIGEQEMLNTIVRAFHRTMVRFAEESLANQPKAVRSTSNTTLSLSEKSYELASKRIEQLRMELLEIAKSDETVDRVYQLNINLFPWTKGMSDE
jgi:uncharacterized protein (TIGR02147 family)